VTFPYSFNIEISAILVNTKDLYAFTIFTRRVNISVQHPCQTTKIDEIPYTNN